MPLQNKKIVILVEDQYQDQEVWYPYFRFKEEGAQVIVAGTGKKSVYKSKHGYEIVADSDASKIKASDVDGIIIPGGYAPDLLRRYDFVNKLVGEIFKQGKLVTPRRHTRQQHQQCLTKNRLQLGPIAVRGFQCRAVGTQENTGWQGWRRH